MFCIKMQKKDNASQTNLDETVWKWIILHPTLRNQFLSEQVLKYQWTVAQKSYSAHNGQRLAFATLPGRIEEFQEKRAKSVA